MENHDVSVKRILIVEDEPAICALCQRALTREGSEVDIAVNGKVARDMIEKQQYGLFLFDIKLPVMSGKELYQWLQEKYPQLVSRVIFTSGSVGVGPGRLWSCHTDSSQPEVFPGLSFGIVTLELGRLFHSRRLYPFKLLEHGEVGNE